MLAWLEVQTGIKANLEELSQKSIELQHLPTFNLPLLQLPLSVPTMNSFVPRDGVLITVGNVTVTWMAVSTEAMNLIAVCSVNLLETSNVSDQFITYLVNRKCYVQLCMGARALFTSYVI